MSPLLVFTPLPSSFLKIVKILSILLHLLQKSTLQTRVILFTHTRRLVDIVSLQFMFMSTQYGHIYIAYMRHEIGLGEN